MLLRLADRYCVGRQTFQFALAEFDKAKEGEAESGEDLKEAN